eukprot:Gb_29289 [translate_table: standard]
MGLLSIYKLLQHFTTDVEALQARIEHIVQLDEDRQLARDSISIVIDRDVLVPWDPLSSPMGCLASNRSQFSVAAGVCCLVFILADSSFSYACVIFCLFRQISRGTYAVIMPLAVRVKDIYCETRDSEVLSIPQGIHVPCMATVNS